MTGQPRWVWFAVWVIVGVGYGLSLIALPSIGLFELPLPVLATILLARRRSIRGGLPGLVSGPGVPLLYVAYLNRSGPGTICATTADGGQACTDESSPWPWAAIAAALLVVGVVVFVARQRRTMASHGD